MKGGREKDGQVEEGREVVREVGKGRREERGKGKEGERGGWEGRSRGSWGGGRSKDRRRNLKLQ